MPAGSRRKLGGRGEPRSVQQLSSPLSLHSATWSVARNPWSRGWGRLLHAFCSGIRQFHPSGAARRYLPLLAESSGSFANVYWGSVNVKSNKC